MKIAKSLILILPLAITACGVVNNFGVIGKNLGRLVSKHPYAVKEEEESEVLKSGKGIVDMYFTKSIGTAWMRVDEDGNIDDKNYTLTYSEAGSRGRRTSQLEPGTYFLNGFTGEGVMSGYYVRSMKMEKFGWDEENKRAKCFSFVVKAGEKIVIPDIVYEGFNEYDKNEICPKLSYSEPRPENAPYKIEENSQVN